METSGRKRRPGRPKLRITIEDPRVPIDIRRSTRSQLHELRIRIGEKTLDDVVKYLLSHHVR